MVFNPTLIFQYFEILSDSSINDLVANTKRHSRPQNIQFANLKQCLDFFTTKLSTLKVCSTSYNKCSSRSHSVLKIKKDGKHMIFIDLAGQEKNSDKDSQFIIINYSYITCLLQDLKKGLSIN